MKTVFDSRFFHFCNLCGEVVPGNSPQVIEAQGVLTQISDIQIAHRHCWEQTFGADAHVETGAAQ